MASSIRQRDRGTEERDYAFAVPRTTRETSDLMEKRRDFSPKDEGRVRDGDSCRQQMRDTTAILAAPNAPNYTRRARCIRLGEHGNSGEVHRT